MQKSLNICFFLLLSSALFAQQETSLALMRHVWQANKLNPAVVQPEKFVVELFGFRYNAVFDGPVYNEIVSEQDGKSVIDIDRLLGYMQPDNTVRADLEYSTLNLALRLKNLTLSAGHALKYHAFLDIPKEFPQIVWQGNAQFIGQTVDLSHQINLTGYHELAFGAAYRFGPLTLGAKAKLLDGISNLATDEERYHASIYTDPDVYQITLDADYVLYAANSVFYNGYDDANADFTFGGLTTERLVFNNGNRGFAYDLGARLELGKLDLALSVLDIGKIKWEKKSYQYIATQTYEYDGLDFSGALTGGENPSLGDALDTLEALFQPEKTYRSYTTQLPRRWHANLLYHLNGKWSLGAMYNLETFRGRQLSAYGAGLTWRALPWLTTGATYSIKQENDSYNNLGLHLTLRWKFIQIFGLTDNLPALIAPGEAKNFSARLGLALLIGSNE